MKFLSLVAISLACGSAFADVDAGLQAFKSIQSASTALSSNQRAQGCEDFKNYLLFKAAATQANTSAWVLRNLDNSPESVVTIASFCSDPNSLASTKDAAQAAASLSANYGLEGVGPTP